MLVQNLAGLSPSTHFVAAAQAILSRGAGLTVTWPHMLMLGAIGAVFFTAAGYRFRKSMTDAA
ncbi:MAG: ABC transporter permease [Halothiobacillus sp.]